MQIVIEKKTNRAVLMFSDNAALTLNARNLQAPDLMVSDVSSETHQIISGDGPVPPLYWVAGALAFSDGAWSVYDQATYDALEDQARATYDKEAKAAADKLAAEVILATQSRLDDFARTRNYDGILSLCTYATSTNPTFSKEGQYGVNMRDATWAKLYEMLAEVEAGIRPVPTGYVDIEAELPDLVWPL